MLPVYQQSDDGNHLGNGSGSRAKRVGMTQLSKMSTLILGGGGGGLSTLNTPPRAEFSNLAGHILLETLYPNIRSLIVLSYSAGVCGSQPYHSVQ